MAKHRRLSPSKIRRCINCPKSIKRSEGLKLEVSRYAEQGTRAHDALESCLLSGVKAESVTRDAEMAASVKVAVDFIDSLPTAVAEAVEDYIPPSPELPDLGGTVDYFRVYEDTLHIVDFKYGAGVAVSPEGNEQLMSYAILVRRKYGLIPVTIKLTIVQPRAPGPAIQTWETSPKALDDFEAVIRRIRDEPDKVRCGDWCRWCPSRDTCPELQIELLHAAQVEFVDMSNTELARLFLIADAIKAKLSELPRILLVAMKRGEIFDGIKAVNSIGCRAWAGSEEEIFTGLKAAKIPRTKSTESKLLSPPKLKKALGSDEKFKHLVYRSDNGPIVVKATDRRRAVDPSVSEFPPLVMEVD